MLLQSTFYTMHNRQLIVMAQNVSIKNQFLHSTRVNHNHHPIIVLTQEPDEFVSKSVICHNGKVIYTNLFNVLTSQWLFKQPVARPILTER